MKSKNIFLLETEDINKIGDICLFPYGINIAGKADIGYHTQYFYITSSEEVKDWLYNEDSGVGKYVKDEEFNEGIIVVYNRQGFEVAEDVKNCKKIVLTNDPKLIADGIQELTEKQLKQIISNYPLDYVEVEKEKVELGEVSGTMYIDFKYNIIIPQKNFYCGEEVEYGDKCGFQCEGCNDAIGVDYGFLPQEKEEEVGMLEVPMPIYKQETLEEATKNWITKNSGIKSLLTPEFVRESFKEGVKWAQERSYTKEDMLEAFNAGNKRGHSGYPDTDNWTQPTFEDFLREKEIKTE